MSNDTRQIDSLKSAAQIVTGTELINSAPSSLMFGRVINVKFLRKDLSSFCIRSDYEPVFHPDGTVNFVPCNPKPAISISYNQVADTTAVSVQIKIQGLFIDREIAGEEIDSAAGNPVISAVVQLGYIDEFPRWDQVSGASDINDFYDVNNNSLAGPGGALSGKQLIIQILNCYPESNPPDRAWVFVGTVATLDKGIRWDHSSNDLVPGYRNPNFPKNLSKIEMMLYQWITRRFIRPGVQHITLSTETTLPDKSIVTDTKIRVWNYNSYFGGKSNIFEYTDIEFDNVDGLLTPLDADALGIKCTCSEALRALSSADIARYGVWQPDKEADVSALAGVGAGFQLFDEAQETVEAQLNAIKNHYSFLRWYMDMDGNLFFYMKNLATDDLVKDPAIKAKQAAKVIKLAAVYDVTMSGMRIIRCPFRQLIDPMVTVLFVSRYRIIDTTGSFFQPSKTHDAFLVILSAVEFSTVGDENMMTLTCVDIPTEDSPNVDFETGIVTPVEGIPASDQSYTTNPDGSINLTGKGWTLINIEIGLYPYDAGNHQWVDLATSLLKDAGPADWPSGMPTIERALQDLEVWNSAPSLGADGLPALAWSSGPVLVAGDASPENNRVPGLALNIPWIFSGVVVSLRHPYKESYDDDYRQKGVSLNG